MDSKPPIDPKALQSIRDLDDGVGEVFREIVELFLRDAPSKIVRMRHAVDKSDPGEVAQGAHSLKGSAGNFGAHRLVELCAEMERLGRDAVIVNAADLLREIEAELERVCRACREEIMSEVPPQ